MEEKDIKKKAIKTLIDSSEEITIPLLPRNWFDSFLQKIRLKKKELKFNLRKIRVGNRERIAAKLFDFPEFERDQTYIYKRVFQLTVDHQETMNYVVAVALQNDRNEPSKQLLDAVKWIDDKLFAYILEQAISSVDVENFLSSIVVISGTAKLMKTENQLTSL